MQKIETSSYSITYPITYQLKSLGLLWNPMLAHLAFLSTDWLTILFPRNACLSSTKNFLATIPIRILSRLITPKINLSAQNFLFLYGLWASQQKRSHKALKMRPLEFLIHGILHCLGQKDANTEQKLKMRELEDDFIKMFHVKQNSHV